MAVGSSARSTDASPLARVRGIPFVAALISAAGLVAGAWYAGLMSSGSQPVTPPLFVVVDVIVAVLVAWSAVALDRAGHTRIARWVLAIALSSAGYIVVAAAAFTATDAEIAGSAWFVAMEGTWYLAPLSVAGVATLVAVEELRQCRGRLIVARVTLFALAALPVVTGLATIDADPFYPGVMAPLDGSWLDSPAVAAVFGISSTIWMLSTAVPAVIAWRAARRSEALTRARLAIVAVAATAPPFTVAMCLLLIAGDELGAISSAVGALVLALAFCISTALVGLGIRVGMTARDDGVSGAAFVSVRRVLGGLWVVTAAQLAVLVAAVLGVSGGGVESYAVGTVAVVLVVSFIAAFAPVARRLGAFLHTAPEPETTSITLSGSLSPRECEVLGLLAEGKSNAAIAGALFLSERTIDSHVSSIFDKLGLGRAADANRRVQAAAAWLRAAAADRPHDRTD